MHNAPIFARRSMHRHWRYLIPVLLMIVVAHLAASPNALDDPFLPKGATVVLFPGLPGDLESERTYSEQLQSLLQLARESAAERILIFSDAPQPSLENPKVQHVKPSRAAFLEAAAQLPASTNPAVAFIWGHGGMQGPTPVFHVRGPRLTPADFKQFADKLTSGPSTWVLMFRGSGRFGAELAAEQRHVLASEGQSMFRNDPIAMNVLLKIWRSKTDSTLRHLLHSFGPGVARWFDEQNLARTEEPTLWAGTEPPRALLAAPLLLEAPSTAAEPPQ